MAGLIWSEHKSPNDDCGYDHVEAETPLGILRIEWKGWKKYDSPFCALPWDEYVCGSDLNDAKAKVQECWNLFADRVNEYTYRDA